MKENINECVANFMEYIIGDFNENYTTKANLEKEKIIAYALNGKLTQIKIRPIVYKFLLRQIHIEKGFDFWVSQQCDSYLKYKKLKTEILALNSIKALKSKTADPLSLKSIQEINELIKLINLDVMRTFQEIELFQDDNIKKKLFNILYVYSIANKPSSKSSCYKQGMQEILSMLLLAIYPYYFPYSKYTDANQWNDIKNEVNSYFHQQREENAQEIYFFFNNEFFLESDLYYLFNELMSKSLIDLYNSESKNLINRCHNIIDNKLKAVDNELYEHFNKVELNYEIIMERWFKCVFNREFPYNQTLILWDAILGNQLIDESTKVKRNYELEFIDYICIAMIEGVRSELLLKDENECMAYLMHYPQRDDIFHLVKIAEDKKIIYEDSIKNIYIIKEKKEEGNKEEESVKLLPGNEIDNLMEITLDDKKSNKTSLSALLGQRPVKKNIINSSKVQKEITIKEYKSSLITIENLVNKYKDKFERSDLKSFENALETLKAYKIK